MADRRYGVAPVPTEAEIRSVDWYGEDLSGQAHERVAFIAVDLTEAVIAGTGFTECTFRDVRFNVSTSTDAAFLNCTFTGCSFFDSSFTGCKLVGSMFDRCTFDLMKVEGGDWSFAGLPGADLRRASFDDVRMREVDLSGARCEGGHLRRVDLAGAWLSKANFTRCDLRGSDLSSLDPLTTEVNQAVITWEQAVVIAGALGLDVQPE